MAQGALPAAEAEVIPKVLSAASEKSS